METNIKFLPVLAIACAALLGYSGAATGDDRKHVASGICVAETASGASKLRHRGSSLEAVGGDVDVICPILKDRKKVKWVAVRHLRPSGSTAARVVKGVVMSCNSTQGGCRQSKTVSTSAKNKFTSVHVETGDLPSGDNYYYFYKSKLPKGWKIVSVQYVEAS